MLLRVTAFVFLGVCPLAANAADAACNQLGREVALRAAEQLQAGLDASERSQLAAIAEAVCVEYTQPVAAEESTVSPTAAPATEAAAAATDTDTATAAEEPRRRLFDLEIIPPEERVRRAGLKRP